MAFSVTFYEEDGFPVERIDANTGVMVAERSLICAWDERTTLVSELYQSANWSYPYRAGLYLKKVEVSPIGIIAGNNDIAAYNGARVKAIYDNTISVASNALYTESFQPTRFGRLVPGHLLHWGTGAGRRPLQQHEQHVVYEPVLQYQLTKYHVANPSTALIMLQGCVNNAPFSPRLASGLVAATGTVLYVGAEMTHGTTLAGVINWTVSLNFKIRAADWNKFWRADTQTYEYLYTPSDEQYMPYPQANLASLL